MGKMDGAAHVQAFLKASGTWLKFAFVLQIYTMHPFRAEPVIDSAETKQIAF